MFNLFKKKEKLSNEQLEAIREKEKTEEENKELELEKFRDSLENLSTEHINFIREKLQEKEDMLDYLSDMQISLGRLPNWREDTRHRKIMMCINSLAKKHFKPSETVLPIKITIL